MQASPGRPHGWTDPLVALLHAVGPPLYHRLQAAELVVEHSEEFAEHWLAVVARDARQLADDVMALIVGVIAWLRELPGIVLLRAKQVARFIIEVLVFVFVKVPRWLILELPRMTFAAATRFLEREVIPTTQFLVEVPLGLGSATVRDVFVRLPVWFAFEGPRAVTTFGRWALMQTLVLTVAMFDRVEGLVYKLIDAGLLVYDSIYGGFRWVFVAAIFHFAPWLFDMALSGIENVISSVRDAILLAIALRRWLWVQLLLIPDRLVALMQWLGEGLLKVLHTTVQLIATAVETVATACVEVINAISALLPRLPRLLLSALARLVDGLAEILRELGVAFTAIAESLWRFVEGLVRDAWQFIVDLVRSTWDVLWFLLVTLPKALAIYAWHAVIATVRWVLVDLPNLLWSTLTFLVVELPRAIVRAIQDAGRALWELLQQVMRPVSTGLTWVLAVAIAPFYLIWHLIGLTQPRGGPRHQS